jgi:hypothetical protein
VGGAALELAVQVVKEDPQLAEYETWEEAALVATVEAFAVDERQMLEVGRQCRWEVRQRQGWE